MKKGCLVLALSAALSLSGCAASYVKYEVSGADSCAPYVQAETTMGVSVTVNDESQCAQSETQPKETPNSE